MGIFHHSAGRNALAVSLMLCATPAFADEPAKPADTTAAPQAASADTAPITDTGEIIVTANKRAENVQTVATAISVLSPAQLQASGVRQFSDLGRIAPSLTIRPAEHPVNSNVSLRGVGTFAFGIGVEPSVAVLVDEVPLAFQARAFTDLPDVERIEVLRGPQSTLYGKAASAGLINIITRQPTDTLRVHANALATTDSEYGGNFSVSGPISPDLGYVFSASYSNWNGNVRNLFDGKKLNTREAVNSRAKIKWKPTADLSFTLSGNYLNGNTDVGRPFIRVGSAALLRGQPGLTPAVVFPGVTISEKNQDVSNNYPSRTKYEGYGGNLRAELGIGKMTLTSITSYDHFRLNDYLDFDDTSASGAFGAVTQIGTFKSRLFTQEVRLQSPGDEPFHYTLGGYFAKVNFERPFFRGTAFSNANWYATSQSRQVAGFVQADWEFLPHVTLTAGGRLQNEKVSYTFQDIFNGNAFFKGSAKDTHGTYRGSLKYEITPDFMVFGTYATGYKGQTYDLTTGFNQARANAGPIRPETSRDKEIGTRMQFLDRHLTVNVTLFDTDFKDLQAQSIETLSDGTQNFRLTNVGKLKTRGVEFDTSARIGQDFTFTGSVAYLDAKYTSYPRAQCYPRQTAAQGCVAAVAAVPATPTTPAIPAVPAYQVLTGQRAVQAPEWKFSLGAEYSPPITDGLRGVAQANWQYQSSVYYVAEDPETFQKGYHIVNLGLGVRSEDRKWEIVGFVNNLFDQQYFPSLVNTAGNFNNQQATQAVLPRDFRRYGGVRVGFNF